MTQTSTEANSTAHCARCGRKLTAVSSLAAGMGRTCARKFREATQDAALAAYKPAQIARATELVEDGAIVAAGDVFYAISSDGVTRYEVSAYRQSCTCPAGEHGRRCYHVLAALALSV